MNLGNSTARMLSAMGAALLLALSPQVASAQAAPATVTTAATPAAIASPPASATEAAPAADQLGAAAAGAVDDKVDASSETVAPGAGAYKPLGPEWIKGQPSAGALDLQQQYSPTGRQATKLHNVLVWLMAIISLFVLGLLLYVMWRFRRGRNPVPSRTTHNTFIEVLWTLLPVLILVGIAIPSISLISAQYETAPKNALTIKATGYQWYWGYSYPDNGGFEVISNMLPEDEAKRRGEPGQLAVDNRMVVPVGEWIRLQTTAADVIHSFAVPSLWFKIDAVPGRLNERRLMIEEPGIYYGQCSELCGAKHAYMPIAIEAVPRPQFEAWLRSQGGTVGPAETPAAPAVAPTQQPESSAQQPAAGSSAAPAAAATPAAPAA
ncbi:cytochrome c oxidase subunit II [Altererythrobacter sp. TH136]|uniref:cytochrome c oxidase subunit II n=1 Tax=Altererythrobacter sp. TH136 TaxID=2067415 RepID=UPI0011648E79|nr:cytochrome c oxidase subunit II [Altererythrobacter sp. TH136]QDM41735.1 cytochrome c oxidase subunit II [Altererythrobacter sp. TH136]